MSTASKITLASTLVGTAGIIAFVHWAQTSEKAAMHAGVVRDMQNQKEKRERQADFDMQRKLEQEYRKVQTVSDSQD
jgi:protein PET117